tara:strand:+ start:991 stop:1233 length:243 start_codon:yes stop_codon:yes gene_type:complete
MSAIAEVTFLVEISLAALALITILNVVVLFMLTGLSGKLKRQNDLLSFIYKRAKLSERREEQRLEESMHRQRVATGKGKK